MTHLPFTLLAYFFNALAVLTSKFLLQKSIPDPLIYIFYISAFSFLASLALPFTKIPPPAVFTLASFSTLLWTMGAYYMFKALKLGHVSRVIPIIGTLIPIILLVSAFQTRAITTSQILAVWLLTAGMVFLTVTDWRGKISNREIMFELLSAAFFAVSYLILRSAYLKFDFFSVLIWSRLILLPLALVMFTIPALRRKVISSKGIKIDFFSKSGLIFLGGQASGAASELLILFSISLANPALVNSLQGTQYVFLLTFAAVLSKKYPSFFEEKYTFPTLVTKIIGISLLGLGLYLLAFTSS